MAVDPVVGTTVTGPSTIYTIGHSDRGVAEVWELLRLHDVTALVDVRRFPGSRKNPQWNQTALSETLPADLSYTWISELGGRRHTPKGEPSPNGGWRVKAFQDYADYMAGEEFELGLQRLVTLVETERAVIMCSEAVPWRCHRRMISDALIVAGLKVEHIISGTRTMPGTITEHARVRDGHLTYPPTD